MEILNRTWRTRRLVILYELKSEIERLTTWYLEIRRSQLPSFSLIKGAITDQENQLIAWVIIHVERSPRRSRLHQWIRDAEGLSQAMDFPLAGNYRDVWLATYNEHVQKIKRDRPNIPRGIRLLGFNHNLHFPWYSLLT